MIELTFNTYVTLIKTAEIKFLRSVARYTLMDSQRNEVIEEE